MLTALLCLALAGEAATTPIPLDKAALVFNEVRLASEEDGGKLWGTTLYGPTIFVDPRTRFAVANQRDADGVLTQSGNVFTGTLPADVTIANTGMTWSGTRWTMVLWGAVGSRPVSQRRLLLHESWHRVQPSLGFVDKESALTELETIDGRVWFQLELRALEAALRASDDEARKKAVADALAFRAKRRAMSETLAARERALENNEGLAEYTGWTLRGTNDAESRLAFAQSLSRLNRDDSFARAMAYYTGPAYGLLLDAASPGWTRKYKVTDELGATLASAMSVSAASVAGDYSAASLRTDEEKRDRDRRERNAKYRALFVDGPTLELPMANGNYSFDPNQVFTLEGIGSVYPTLSVSAGWGILKATSGALISSDFSRFVVAYPGEKNGWTLELKPGWKITPASKQGNFKVVPQE